MNRRIALPLIATMIFSIASFANEDSDLPQIKRGRYIAGGITSIFAPFGIGQAVQGRYGETGWIFTVTDSASLALVTSGIIVWTTQIANSVNNSTNCVRGACTPTVSFPAAGFSLYLAGLAALTGSRIWAVVDAWSTPASQGRIASTATKKPDNRLAFTPMIAPNYMGFEMQF